MKDLNQDETSFNESSFMKYREKNFQELPSIDSSNFYSTSKANPSPAHSFHALELSPFISVYGENLFETPSKLDSNDIDSSIEDWVNSSELLDETYLSILNSVPGPPPPSKEIAIISSECAIDTHKHSIQSLEVVRKEFAVNLFN